MTPPIRPIIHTLVEFPVDAEEMSLRQAIDWWKAFEVADIGVPTAMELDYINKRWAALCQALGSREQIAAGALSYFLGEMAQAEAKLAQTAAQEYKNATGQDQV